MPIDKRKITIAIWWAAVAALFFAVYSRHFIDSDEGVILAGADRILRGQSPYEGFFAFVPPGGFYAVAGAFFVLGRSYLAAKAVGTAAVVGGALAVYRLGRGLGSDPGRAALPALALMAAAIAWPTVNHNVFALPAVLWSAYFIARGLGNGRRRDLILAGLLAGLAGIFLQHHGAAALAAGISTIALLRRPIKTFAADMGAFMIAAAVLPLSLLLFWTFGTLWSQLVEFPLLNYHETNRLPLYLFLAAFALWGITVWQSRRTAKPALLTLSLLSGTLLLFALARPDLLHISLALTPLLPLWSAADGDGKPARVAMNAGWAVFGALALYASAVNLAYFPPGYDESRSPYWRTVEERCPGDGLYAGPFLPGVYFETGRRNPTPYDFLIERQHTPEQFAAAAAALAADPPACAITDYRMTDKFGHRGDNPVDRWLMNGYRRTIEYGNFILWQRISDAGR